MKRARLSTASVLSLAAIAAFDLVRARPPVAWLDIHKGMSLQEVVTRIGPPDEAHVDSHLMVWNQGAVTRSLALMVTVDDEKNAGVVAIGGVWRIANKPFLLREP